MEFVIALLLTIHLVLVNLSMSGPIFCIWLDIRGRRQPQATDGSIAHQLACWSLGTLLLGSVIGTLLFVWYWWFGDPSFLRAVARLQPRIWWGFWELLFSIVCLSLYLLWWRCSKRRTLLERCGHHLLALLASTNLMYHFPPLFIILARLRSCVDQPAEVISAAEFRTLLFSAQVVATTLHYWLASVATAGVWIVSKDALLSSVNIKEPPNVTPALVVAAARTALVATLLQIPVGWWLLTLLSESQQTLVLGGNTVLTLIFIVAVFSVVGLIYHLAAVAFGDVSQSTRLQSFGLLLLVIWLMSCTLVCLQ